MTMELEEKKNPPAPSPAERLQDPRDYVRLGALAELLLAGKEAPIEVDGVGGCLTDFNHNIRIIAVEVLCLYGAPAVSALIRGLDEAQPMPVRIAAVSALGRTGPAAAPAIDSLSKCLQSEDASLRWHASFALSKIGTDAIPSLRRMLQSTIPYAATAAVNSLEWMGEKAIDAVDDIKKLASTTSSSELQTASLSALVKITGDPSSRMPVILSMLETGDPAIRKASVERLGYLGPVAGECVPDLLNCLSDPSGEVRAAVILALARISTDPTQTVPPFTDLLSDPDPDVRANAAMALAKFGPDATSALPALKTMQQEKDERLAAIARASAERIEKGS